MESSDEQFQKLPPSNVDAEMCFNASAILDPKYLDQFSGMLRKEMFYSPDCAIIFECLSDLRRRSMPIDAVILRDELTKRKLLEEVGGTKYIRDVLEAVPSAAHAPHYAGIIIQAYKRRRLIEIGNEMLRDAYGGNGADADELVTKHASQIAGMITDSQVATFRQLGEATFEVMDRMNKPNRQTIIPTGIGPLDAKIGGVGEGEMCIVAGFMSVGKSTFARTIMRRLSRLKIPVGLISVEESEQKIAANILSAESDVINNRIRKGVLDDAEVERVYDGFLGSVNYPAYIATQCFDIDAVRSVAMRMKAAVGVKVILIDYLQKIKGPGRDRYQIVTNLSLEISRMFKELKVAGYALCQLNREGLKRDDHRPRLGDLKESGQLDQDADMVLMLHREDFYHLDAAAEPSYNPTGLLEVIVAKSRDGERGHIIKLQSNLRYQRFDDYLDVPMF